MSFWNTFVKVWQVRTSIKIQESIEDTFVESQRKAELESNISEIISEVIEKNSSWQNELDKRRKKI
jgi:hypothetical protein